VLRLYDYSDSGNGYKVRLLLAHLNKPFELVEVDITRGETRTPEFLRRNPNGRIPVLELPDGRCLAESNAILLWLADETPWLPNDPWQRALVFQWLFFEQYSHEPNIATIRYWLRHEPPSEQRMARIAERRPKGEAALRVMNSHLRDRDFFVSERATVADIALYAYTHVAEQAEFDLDSYPNLRRWSSRVAALPGHVSM
jgi:glutathione S-transferase